MCKELADLIVEGKHDEAIAYLKRQIEERLSPHQQKLTATLLKTLGERLIENESTKEIVERWRIECFNNVRFSCQGKEVISIHWKRKKAEELFIFLLLQPNYRATKEAAAEKLFYCDDLEQISNQLYVIVHHVKRTLYEYFHIDKAISIKNGIIQLDEEMIDHVDTEKYSTLVRVGNQLWATYPDLSIELFDEAQQLYGEVVPNLQYLDWLEEYRKDFLLKQTSILRRLAHYYAEQQGYERAEHYYIEWIQLAPYEEEAYQGLMRLYMQMNKLEAAKYWYTKMEQLFRAELETAPSNETITIISERLQ